MIPKPRQFLSPITQSNLPFIQGMQPQTLSMNKGAWTQLVQAPWTVYSIKYNDNEKVYLWFIETTQGHLSGSLRESHGVKWSC